MYYDASLAWKYDLRSEICPAIVVIVPFVLFLTSCFLSIHISSVLLLLLPLLVNIHSGTLKEVWNFRGRRNMYSICIFVHFCIVTVATVTVSSVTTVLWEHMRSLCTRFVHELFLFFWAQGTCVLSVHSSHITETSGISICVNSSIQFEACKGFFFVFCADVQEAVENFGP